MRNFGKSAVIFVYAFLPIKHDALIGREAYANNGALSSEGSSDFYGECETSHAQSRDFVYASLPMNHAH